MGLCSAELEVFRSVLEDAEVERTSHLLSSEDRCIYRITATSRHQREQPYLTARALLEFSGDDL